MFILKGFSQNETTLKFIQSTLKKEIQGLFANSFENFTLAIISFRLKRFS